MSDETKKSLRCSFCGKREEEVRRMIQGPGARICDQCVQLCMSVLEEELEIFVPLLEEAGVTSFHVTLANHSRLEDTIPPAGHPYFSNEGCFLKFCSQVRRWTSRPICGVGGLTDPDFVEEQLRNGSITCAAMSRQLLADPQWPKKVMENRRQEIRRCIRCNRKCLGGLMAHKGTGCIYDEGR